MSRARGLVTSVNVALVVSCSLLTAAAGQGRMRPDDPHDTPIFLTPVKAEMTEKIKAVLERYAGTAKDEALMTNHIRGLASYDKGTDKITGKTTDVTEIAWRELRGAGSNAVPALVAATSYPNVRIRRFAVCILADIAMDTQSEMTLLSVFLRSSADADAEVRGNAVGSIGNLCRSLAKRRQYEDCRVLVSHIAEALNDSDDTVRSHAADFLYRFDRFDLVPETMKKGWSPSDFTHSWTCPLPRAK